MNIDELTIGEAKQIIKMLGGGQQDNPVEHGFQIVVLDNGFVYVGHVMTDDKFVRISDAHNIRRWGTSCGLGQLALQGPQPETKLDRCGAICAPIGELKHLMEVSDEAAWTPS